MGVSSSVKFWDRVIEEFYSKYKGIAEQHKQWMNEATSSGQLVMPTGRAYKYQPYITPRGESKWPRTTILNYPVQGLGADIVSVARISLFKRLRQYDDIKFISTVHDSIVLDTVQARLDTVVKIVNGMFNDLPRNCSQLFGVDFNLPLAGEISYGNNLNELTEVK